MKIGVLGHFARNTNLCDGQTVKTRSLEKALQQRGEEILTVDSYKWKKHPFAFLFRIIKLILKSDVLIMLPDAGGVKIYPYIVNLFANKRKIKVYDVVGAWLPGFLTTNHRIKNQLLRFDLILVETSTMKRKLEELSFSNVEIVPNFKDIKPLPTSSLEREFSQPLPFCIFSRVMKEKGISDAVYAIERINRERGKIACTLDIYGPVQETYSLEFDRLLNSHASFVKYCGITEPEKSVDVLKSYYMLLFPTLFYTEGIPGTIIDAFSAGVPVLSSEWESYSDVLSENDSITFKFGDKLDLYNKLNFCIDNSDAINSLRDNCIVNAGKFSLESAFEQIMNLLCKEMNFR